MSTIITIKHKIHHANLYKAGFSDADDNLYLFVGKSDPWSDPDDVTIGDTEPPTAIDTVIDEMTRWNTMIAMKKIIESSVSNAIPRHDWDDTGETKYIEYSDNDVELFNHPTTDEVADAGNDYTAGSFYVLTDDYNVYKCISNGGFVKSTVKPTGTSTSIIETADGYKWKYMYTVSTSDALKFATPDVIPVKTLTADDGSAQWDVQAATTDGAVEHIKVLTAGSGYTAVHSGTCQNGGGANTVKLSTLASAVNDFYNGCTIFIDSGQNAGQYLHITDYDGATRLATVSASWTSSIPPDSTSGYEVTPKITISGGSGSGLVGRVYTDAGAVSRVGIVARGSEYRFTEGLTVTISGGGGTAATARAIISPIGGHGKDPVGELGGYYTVANVKIEYDESDFITKNDYRIMGIVSGILNYGTTVIATANTLRATKKLTCNTLVGSFDEDEEIIGGTSGAHAIVVQSDETSPAAAIQYYQTPDTGFTAFSVSETVTGQVSGATAAITALNNPEIAPYKGKILYVENRRPLMRSPDQYEDIKIVVIH